MDEVGSIPLIAKNENGYKNIIKLSSKSYLENGKMSAPHCNFEDLLNYSKDIIILSGGISGLIGKLFNNDKIDYIKEIYKKFKYKIKNNFYIEIQRHEDLNEKNFENINLKFSKLFNIPIIASNEVYYIDQSMYEAHDALMCIGSKSYVNDKDRKN